MRSAALWAWAVLGGCGGVAAGDGAQAWAEGPRAPGVEAGDAAEGRSQPPAVGSPAGTAAAPKAPQTPARGSGKVLLRGAAGGDLVLDPATGRIADEPGDARVIDVSGRWIVPAFIDSHVHLAYYPVGEELLKAGVVAAVDLAAPERFVAPVAERGARVLWAGPMVTPLQGYPTRSWGAGGYGAECGDRGACEAEVDRLAEAGARLIKVPVGQGPDHHVSVLAGIVERAHGRQLPVTCHALGDDAAARAAAAGVDVLAHTPTASLTDDTVAAWSGRAVISTLSAFGGAATTVDNLRRLRAAGATVLYGTDLGNTRTAGIDPAEIRLLQEAGLDGPAIIEAATAAPAQLWGLADLGALTPGKSASLLVLTADPYEDPLTLATPEQVWIDGVRLP